MLKMNKDEIVEVLKNPKSEKAKEILFLADEVRKKSIGEEVHLRAIIEISNYCKEGCLYCGLNKNNKSLKRYRLSEEEIFSSALKASKFGFKTIVFQSGEDPLLKTEFIENVVKRIKDEFDVAITLSLGERKLEDYQRWKDAGADRYLLKFETSDLSLYNRLRNRNEKIHNRVEILKEMRKIGYEIGSGIMVGIPFQSYESLVDDLFLMKELDLDMIAIGPYIPHKNTPLNQELNSIVIEDPEATTLVLVAFSRILNPFANIPSTTALSVIDPKDGRINGLKCGANVIMPDLTPEPYKSLYEIYDGKTSLPEWNETSQRNLLRSLKIAGRIPSTTKGNRIKKISPQQ